MRRVTLAGTELSATVLGFGCASLMGRISRPRSVRMLEEAFDAGVTHFDVARMYGYGAAETAVGDFIAGRRDQVTVATKFGIFPPRCSGALDAAKAVARAVVAVSPRMRTALRARAGRMVTGGHFGVEDARRSLETSLRELRTDHVDLLLLHECRPADVASDDLLAFLEACVRKGQIRHFGIATDIQSVERIVHARPAFARVAQFPNDVVTRHAERLAHVHDGGVITHSALGESLRQLHGHVTSTPRVAAEWSRALGVDCTDVRELGRLMLGYAIEANPGGVVLFSSLSERNIRANAALAAAGVPSGQIEVFRALASRATLPAASVA